MSKILSLKHKEDFLRVYKNAKKWYCNEIVVYFYPNKTLRFSVVASKKIGNAVERNLVKRRLRAVFALFSTVVKRGDYIVVARDCIRHMAFEDIKNNFRKSLEKLGAL